MDSTGSDHSISRNISIPQWMRPRFQEGFDTEISTLSPPNQDDSFFYVPYSKLMKTPLPVEPSIISTSTESSNPSPGITSAGGASGSKSFKHTQPCLKFLGESKNMDISDMTSFSKDDKKVSKVKSFGTDDGFKSEAAQCGHSVVQVAQQMIADRLIGHPSMLEGDKKKLGHSEMHHIKPRVRRGSKSLPASPLSTPDSTPQIQRKNRYFTGAFVEPSEESSKFSGGWLVAGLLGVHRENLSDSQSDLSSDTNNNASLQNRQSHHKTEQENEKKHDQPTPSLHESRSVASLVKMGNPSTDQSNKKARPKPSELREMNFWSPTSM